MAVAAPKIAVHLYLNNPYGLISATIPNYVINKVHVDDQATPTPRVANQDTAVTNKTPEAEKSSPSTQSSPREVKKGANVNSKQTVHEHVSPSADSSPWEVNKFTSDKSHLSGAKASPRPDVNHRMNKKWKPLPEVRHETRNDSSCEQFPSNASVFYDNSPSPVQRHGGNPTLGFTWSINLNKPPKMAYPRQPPPPTLLEKLGRLKTNLNYSKPNFKKRKQLNSKYLIKKLDLLDLGDHGQRKMSERLSEWLDQYTEISQKQQDYLSRIHELRRGLEHNENKHVLATIENMRGQQKEKYKRKYPLYSLTRMEGSPVNQGPAPFPSRQCLFHDEKHGIPKLKIAPHTSPRKLAPLVTPRGVNGKYTVSKDENNKHHVTPRPEMTSLRTEYESFESIAKRNKLNLTQFFNSSLSHRRSHRRLPMSVSTVTIIDEVPEEDAEQKAFITDLSSRKHVVTNGIRDQKPG